MRSEYAAGLKSPAATESLARCAAAAAAAGVAAGAARAAANVAGGTPVEVAAAASTAAARDLSVTERHFCRALRTAAELAGAKRERLARGVRAGRGNTMRHSTMRSARWQRASWQRARLLRSRPHRDADCARAESQYHSLVRGRSARGNASNYISYWTSCTGSHAAASSPACRGRCRTPRPGGLPPPAVGTPHPPLLLPATHASAHRRADRRRRLP